MNELVIWRYANAFIFTKQSEVDFGIGLVGRKEAQYKVGDTVVCQMKTLSSKGKGVSQKLELKWSKPMVIVKFLKPSVVQLAVAESGVLARKAHVSQIKKYYLSVG